MDTKKLRQKILDLAIHGKLVPQDPNDEPASVLLERINAEKERLIKEGKIKRSKKSAKTSDTPHYPYLLPNGWEWCRLNEIAESSLGKTLDKSRNTGKIYPYLCATNVKWNDFDLSVVKTIKLEDNEKERYQVLKGDLLICEGGDVGRSAIWDSDEPIYYQNALHRVRFFSNIVADFYLYLIWCYKNYNWIDDICNGVTIKHFTQDKINALYFPLPPLAEQQRIVMEIKKWFALIDQIEQGKVDLQTAIKQTKNKILDFAIHGKLVPQDPKDEPALELLKRINPNAKITCDNGHDRKCPNGWIHCRLCDVLKITMGQSPKGVSINKDSGIEFHQGKLYFSDKYLQSSNIFTTEETKIAEANSLLLCVRAPVGIVNITKNKICIGRGLCSLKPLKGNINFYFYLLQTLQKSFENQATGTTFKAISCDVVKNEVIRLPPIAEQQRIVDKIEELFSVLDNIQNALEA